MCKVFKKSIHVTLEFLYFNDEMFLPHGSNIHQPIEKRIVARIILAVDKNNDDLKED